APAQALAAELALRGNRAVLMTDERGSAHGESEGISEVRCIRAGGLAGKGTTARMRSGFELLFGTFQARRLLARLRPQAVVGFGGYASVPTMLAARFAGLKTAIHEQNAVLGRANRLFAPKVSCIATSFEESQGLPASGAAKIVHTGMPVRPAVAAVRDRPYPALGPDGPIKVLVLGGSQGAHILSEVVPAALKSLPQDLKSRLRVSQQCRPEDLGPTEQAYAGSGIEADLSTFYPDVPQRLTDAHLLISRSGASTIAEILAVGRPAILVPFPHAIDDHQSFNAHAVAEAGAGWLMPQESFTASALASRLESLFGLPATLQKAATAAGSVGRANAAERLADMVCELLPSNGEPESGRKAA
ncbi:MAG: undecaprenyldiphospho-muramoylpentapeptide beta-N-acetylglucosaminyltransferase, partial [Rhodospirillales bacterium]|nr:undecaprenyldiphospho-muramoylpentapeptide beta-N-acetylglucosaminyltransferase [Rhodospirillales bacterium]